MTGPAEARDGPRSLADLVEAARLLGCGLPAEAVPTSGQPGERLILAAVVLGAAEIQVVNAESEILQLGGTVADARSAADVTALVTTSADPWACRRWLMWHSGRLIHQLTAAERRGDLPPEVGAATARCIYAVHQLLVELSGAGEDQPDLDRIPGRAVTEALEELRTALDDLTRLAPDPDRQG